MDYEPAREPYRRVSDGAWIITRYEDAVSALRAPSIASPSAGSVVEKVSARLGGRFDDLSALVDHLPIFQNEPDHAPSRVFLRDIILAMSTAYTDATIDDYASKLLKKAPRGADVDVVSQICYPLPDALIGRALGYSPDELRDLRAAGSQVIEGWRPAMSLRDYERRQSVSADIRRRLANRWESQGCPILNGQRAATAEAISNEQRDAALVLLIVLTIDTMAGFLGNVLCFLAYHPEWQEALRAQPGRMSGFVEEALRLCGPIRQRSRIVAGGALELRDVTIPTGAFLHVKIESASRDPEAYPEPEKFDPDRKGPPVLAFAAGPHLCLGAVFARSLAKRFLTVLLDGFYIFPGAAPPRMIAHRELRQFTALPLRLQTREAGRCD